MSGQNQMQNPWSWMQQGSMNPYGSMPGAASAMPGQQQQDQQPSSGINPGALPVQPPAAAMPSASHPAAVPAHGVTVPSTATGTVAGMNSNTATAVVPGHGPSSAAATAAPVPLASNSAAAAATTPPPSHAAAVAAAAAATNGGSSSGSAAAAPAAAVPASTAAAAADDASGAKRQRQDAAAVLETAASTAAAAAGGYSSQPKRGRKLVKEQKVSLFCVCCVCCASELSLYTAVFHRALAMLICAAL